MLSNCRPSLIRVSLVNSLCVCFAVLVASSGPAAAYEHNVLVGTVPYVPPAPPAPSNILARIPWSP